MSASLQHLYDIDTIVKLPNTFTVIRLNIYCHGKICTYYLIHHFI